MRFRATWQSLLLGILLLVSPLLAATGAITGYEEATANPTSPGYHKLLYWYKTADGRDASLPLLLYLPQEYGQKPGPWPLLVFLHGLGERGHDAQMLFMWGVPRDLFEHPEVRQWAPFAMLIPQCPADVRWETPGMGTLVASLVREIAGQWPIDKKRIYLTGLSMGGSGCWAVARDGPDLFAVVAPIVGNAVEPPVVAAALKGSGATCLVISGTTDPKSEPGSSQMVEALRGAGVDTVQVKVPFGSHSLWPPYYGSKAFYSWLLSHERGSQPPADRLGAEALVAMAADITKGTQERYRVLNEELQKVAQWWEMDNCNLARNPGLRTQLMGHANVYVTHPLTAEAPCRLQTTTTLPAGRHSVLRLRVGHHPKGSWKLGLRVNETEYFSTVVDASHSQKCWATVEIDLTKFAGQEVRLQVVQSNNAAERDDAYWEEVRVVSAP